MCSTTFVLIWNKSIFVHMICSSVLRSTVCWFSARTLVTGWQWRAFFSSCSCNMLVVMIVLEARQYESSMIVHMVCVCVCESWAISHRSLFTITPSLCFTMCLIYYDCSHTLSYYVSYFTVFQFSSTVVTELPVCSVMRLVCWFSAWGC